MTDRAGTEDQVYTPPLGFDALTPLYDAAIAAFTRERKWRARIVACLAPQTGDRILDIGSGTGRLAEAIHCEEPKARYLGVDPDKTAAAIACKRARKTGSAARFCVRFFDGTEKIDNMPPNKIVTSLVLHQTPLAEKRRIIQCAHDALPKGGAFVLADYGLQNTPLMRFLFRWTVQALDGVENTQPNADGVLSELLNEAGFHCKTETQVVPTPTGAISIFLATKSN
jgi:ubiquinone/menaquinone biosynthesis C-methylase UbiE